MIKNKINESRTSKQTLDFDTSLSIRIRLLADQVLAPENEFHGFSELMSVKEWQVIAVLAKFGKMTNKELCQYMKQGHVAISRAVKKLKRKSLVESQPSEIDKRNIEIQLTIKGLALHDEIVPKRIKLNTEIENGLTLEERTTFLTLIYKLEKHVQFLNNGSKE